MLLLQRRGDPYVVKVFVLLLQRRGDPYVVKVFVDIAGSSHVQAKSQEFKVMQSLNHRNIVKFYAMDKEVRLIIYRFIKAI